MPVRSRCDLILASEAVKDRRSVNLAGNSALSGSAAIAVAMIAAGERTARYARPPRTSGTRNAKRRCGVLTVRDAPAVQPASSAACRHARPEALLRTVFVLAALDQALA